MERQPFTRRYLGYIKEPDLCQSKHGRSVRWRQHVDGPLQIFNASHMAPYDVPHITHDMILRFMGVNFSAIVDGSARIPSSIGTETKPIFIATSTAKPTNLPVSGKTPEQDKAMWEGEPSSWLTKSFANDPISILQCGVRRAYPCSYLCWNRRVPVVSRPQESRSITANEGLRGGYTFDQPPRSSRG